MNFATFSSNTSKYFPKLPSRVSQTSVELKLTGIRLTLHAIYRLYRFTAVNEVRAETVTELAYELSGKPEEICFPF